MEDSNNNNKTHAAEQKKLHEANRRIKWKKKLNTKKSIELNGRGKKRRETLNQKIFKYFLCIVVIMIYFFPCVALFRLHFNGSCTRMLQRTNQIFQQRSVDAFSSCVEDHLVIPHRVLVNVHFTIYC